jgi:hypothetical protein
MLIPDFGERVGADGNIVDELADAIAAVPVAIAGEEIALDLAIAVMFARLGRHRPAWKTLLRRYRPTGKPH